jgi:sulfur relay (sulfurtransferase) complex TusBCD TusD component (DsrE family)
MDAGIKVFVCSRSCTERGINSVDQLIDGVKMGGMFELIDIVDEADVVLEF